MSEYRIVDLGEIMNDIILIFQRSIIFPHKTGNAKYNAVHGDIIDENTIRITLGGKNAPYIVYVNFNPFAGSSKVIPNKHLYFIEKIVEGEVIPYLQTL